MTTAPARASRTRFIALAVVFVVAVFSVFLATRGTANEPVSVDNGDRPEIRVETPDGRLLTNADFAGKVLYINFWNTWCEPCKREEPALAAFHAAHADDPDFAMLAIVHRDTPGAVEGWMAEHTDAGYQVVYDPGERTARAFGVTGQPESYMLAADGSIVALQKSEMNVAGLEQMLAEARAESS